MTVVKPSILKWARESAGLSLEEAAAKVGINAARGVSGADRLLALETEEGEVSRPVLLKMAKIYRRPLVSFYLDGPPARGDRGEDFRTLPDRHTYARALVAELLRDMDEPPLDPPAILGWDLAIKIIKRRAGLEGEG